MVDDPVRYDLASSVRDALALHVRVGRECIVTFDNGNKYSAAEGASRSDKALPEIFELMWQLNRDGLADDSLGSTTHTSGSLRHTIARLTSRLTETIGNNPFNYVELGPEPAKTSHILARLLDLGADVRSYTAVDINPASKPVVLQEIGSVLARDCVHYREKLFEDVTPDDVHRSRAPSVFTMLGFEEGNDQPQNTATTLSQMMLPGDFLISEMQLLPRAGWQPIFDFYALPAMRRFSQVVLSRYVEASDSIYGIYLVPVDLGEGWGRPWWR